MQMALSTAPIHMHRACRYPNPVQRLTCVQSLILVSPVPCIPPNTPNSEHGNQLDEYVVRGVGNNLSFLRAIVDHPRFIEGRLTTNFIAEEYPEGFHGVEITPQIAHEMVAVATMMQVLREDTMARIEGNNKVDAWIHPTASLWVRACLYHETSVLRGVCSAGYARGGIIVCE